MIKCKNRTINRKESAFSEVTGNAFQREILTELKWILTKKTREHTTNHYYQSGERSKVSLKHWNCDAATYNEK